MDDEKLIQMVRDYPVLYDLSHAKYNDANYKNGIWREIGKQLKEDWPSCKTRWNNIRDNFRKSLKKSLRQSGTKKVKCYKYASQMGFVKNFFDESRNKKNVKEKSHNEKIGDEVYNIIKYESIEENDDNSELPIENDVDPLQSNPVLLNQDFQVPYEDNETQNNKKTSSKSMDYLIQPSNETQFGNKNVNAVDGFLMGIGATLKTLPPYLLNLAKSEIFATTQKYELQMLQQSNPTSTPSPTMDSYNQYN